MQVSERDPVQELSAAADKRRACLIVTGTRGRGPVRAELFGSVSCGLVQAARRPVMLVPRETGDAPAHHG
jgi:nucleotide-binding universal stress UspA family protein